MVCFHVLFLTFLYKFLLRRMGYVFKLLGRRPGWPGRSGGGNRGFCVPPVGQVRMMCRIGHATAQPAGVHLANRDRLPLKEASICVTGLPEQSSLRNQPPKM